MAEKFMVTFQPGQNMLERVQGRGRAAVALGAGTLRGASTDDVVLCHKGTIGKIGIIPNGMATSRKSECPNVFTRSVSSRYHVKERPINNFPAFLAEHHDGA
jgi:hypothetical protein